MPTWREGGWMDGVGGGWWMEADRQFCDLFHANNFQQLICSMNTCEHCNLSVFYSYSIVSCFFKEILVL